MFDNKNGLKTSLFKKLNLLFFKTKRTYTCYTASY